MKYVLILFLLVATSIVRADAAPAAAVKLSANNHLLNDSSARDIVEDAVFSLLKLMAPSKEQVKHVLKNSKLFIPKCNLCSGSKAAFEEYMKKAGAVPTPDYAALFNSPNHDVQFKELQTLVETAIRHYLEDNSFSAEETKEIKEKLSQERLRSMKNLHVKKCATCDGAAEERKQ